jgi:hypothetical protein
MKPVKRNNLCKINVPAYIYSLMCTLMVSAVDDSDETTDIDEQDSRTELDSHANMPVVGRNAYIISDTGRVADVNAFSSTVASTIVLHVASRSRWRAWRALGAQVARRDSGVGEIWS